MRCGISSGITTSSTEALLRQTPASAPKLIAVESVYSMDADIAPTVVHLRLCLQPGHLGDGPKLPPSQTTRCEGFHTLRVGQNGLITAASQRIGERIQAWFSPPGYDTEGGFCPRSMPRVANFALASSRTQRRWNGSGFSV